MTHRNGKFALHHPLARLCRVIRRAWVLPVAAAILLLAIGSGASWQLWAQRDHARRSQEATEGWENLDSLEAGWSLGLYGNREGAVALVGFGEAQPRGFDRHLCWLRVQVDTSPRWSGRRHVWLVIHQEITVELEDCIGRSIQPEAVLAAIASRPQRFDRLLTDADTVQRAFTAGETLSLRHVVPMVPWWLVLVSLSVPAFCVGVWLAGFSTLQPWFADRVWRAGGCPRCGYECDPDAQPCCPECGYKPKL